MSDTVYINDIGTRITLNAGSDISTSAVRQIKYNKPDNTSGVWNASLSGTNYLYYDFQSGDIDITGIWEFQIYIESPTWSGHGKTVEYLINDLFE